MALFGAGDITHPMQNAKEMLLSTGRLALKVTPKARMEGLAGMNDAGELVVKVRCPPEDGRANEAVVAVIAEAFSLPKSRLEITRGTASRHKIIAYRA